MIWCFIMCQDRNPFEIEWARYAAQMILTRHSDEAAIDTADYRECSFILEAARLALTDDGLASKIGGAMEPRRENNAV